MMRGGTRALRLVASLFGLTLVLPLLSRADEPAQVSLVPVAEPSSAVQSGESSRGNASGITEAPASPTASPTPAASGAAPASAGIRRGPLPSHPAQRFSLLKPKSWPFSLIPVPEIATDPNQGTTAGLLPVFLFNDEHHHIHYIFAPDINDNTIMGAGGTIRFLAYPSEDTQWYGLGFAAQNIARRVDLYYSTGRTHDDWWSFDGRFFFERDPTDRFFGIGNDTEHSGQTNYTTEQVYALLMPAVNLSHQLQISLFERPRYVRVFNGALSTLPFIGKLYPTLKGLGGGTDLLNRAMISYDTRDSPDIPRSGCLLRAFAGFSDRSFLSSVSYSQFGAEARQYVTLGDRVTLAGHLFLQYIPAGNETPFWAMARLGGYDSLLTDQQTLRGYGAGRFVDNNLSVANIEVRTRVYDLNIFDTHGIIELAPFFEAGRVFHTVRDDPVTRLHPVGGMGFRGIAEPFVVGYVDVGVGGEGAAIFSGVNYPF
jgi:hypothetical protein